MSKTTEQAEHRENQLNGSSSMKGIGAWLAHRAKPYTPPWIATGLVGAAGLGGYPMWHDSAFGGVGLTLGSVALTGAAWWIGKRLDPARRLHSAITVAAASGWVTCAALAGPWVRPLPDIYLIGGIVTALSWNFRQLHPAPAAEGGSADKGLLEKVGLARTKLGEAKVEPNRVTVPYALPAGELTNADVAKAIAGLESGLDVPPGAVRVQPSPDSSRRGQIVIVPEDMLKTPTVWPGPSRPGASIAEPLRIGVYDDGSELLLPLLEAIHILVMGMTGSGKTEGAVDILLEILSRKDVVVWLSDSAKAGQDFQPLIPAMDWVALDTPSTMSMVAAVQAAIPERTKWLRDHGYRAWEPAAAEKQTSRKHSCKKLKACGCDGLQYLLAWFEEAAKTLRDMGDDSFTGIAQEARSAGVSLVISMQRASGYQLSTDTRASLPAALCFGVRGDDASFALPEEVLDAGANPAAWGNKRKGYVYLVSAGVDEDLYANPARTFWTGPGGSYEQMAAWVVATFASVRPGVDLVTAAAAERTAGERFVRRVELTGQDGPAVLSLTKGEPEDDEPGVYLAEDDGLVDPEDADLDVTAELEPTGQGSELPPSDLSPEEARELLVELIEMLAGMGPGTIGPADLGPFLDQLGRGRSWVSKEMKRLSEEGRLAPTAEEGRYRLVPVLAGV
ncbi:plasmid transfer protein TraB [Kitasatospora sp. NPDC001159]